MLNIILFGIVMAVVGLFMGVHMTTTKIYRRIQHLRRYEYLHQLTTDDFNDLIQVVDADYEKNTGRPE